MSTQLVTPTGLVPAPPAHRRKRLRNAAIAAGAVAILAAGGYAITDALGPDDAGRATRDGAVPATNPERAMNDLRDSLANQYRTAPVTAPTPTAAQLDRIRDGLANQYRTVPTTAHAPPPRSSSGSATASPTSTAPPRSPRPPRPPRSSSASATASPTSTAPPPPPRRPRPPRSSTASATASRRSTATTAEPPSRLRAGTAAGRAQARPARAAADRAGPRCVSPAR